ncbi:MAG: hypothetical protein Q9208_003525 [Pyrenodesmia sp. 3 TL-2023]
MSTSHKEQLGKEPTQNCSMNPKAEGKYRKHSEMGNRRAARSTTKSLRPLKEDAIKNNAEVQHINRSAERAEAHRFSPYHAHREGRFKERRGDHHWPSGTTDCRLLALPPHNFPQPLQPDEPEYTEHDRQANGLLRKEAVMEHCHQGKMARRLEEADLELELKDKIHQNDVQRRRERVRIHQLESQLVLDHEQGLDRAHLYRNMYAHLIGAAAGLADTQGRARY